MILACECKDMNLRALNLVVGRYLWPFEGVYNICTYNIGTLYSIYNMERVYDIGTYNIDTYKIEGVYNIDS